MPLYSLCFVAAHFCFKFPAVRWCWEGFQCRGVFLISIIVEQEPTALAVGAGGGCLDSFTLYLFSPLSHSLWKTARYRLKYCLKGPLNPKTTNQLTQQCILLSILMRKRLIKNPFIVFSHLAVHITAFCIDLWLKNFHIPVTQ